MKLSLILPILMFWFFQPNSMVAQMGEAEIQLPLRPQSCSNDIAALVDANGKKVTDCIFKDLVRNIKREERIHKHLASGPIHAADDYAFIFGQLEDDSWVLIDSTGYIVPGPPIINENKHFRITASKLRGSGHQIICGGNVYLYFDAKRELFGPYLHHWKSPGCVQHNLPDKHDDNYLKRFTLDSTLVLLDKQGNVKELDTRMFDYESINGNFYASRSADDKIQIWNRNEELIFEGGYQKSNYISTPTLISLANKEFEYPVSDENRPKFCFIDTTGKILLDTLYSKIDPMPFANRSIYKPVHYVAQHDKRYALLDSNLQVLFELDDREVKTFPKGIFSIQQANSQKLNVYQGNTTNLLFKDLKTYDKYFHHIVTKENEAHLVDIETFKTQSKPYLTVKKSPVQYHSYQYIFTDKNGFVGGLDSEGKELIRLQADSLVDFRAKKYKDQNLFYDSLLCFRRGEQFGIYNIKTKTELEVWSDEPMFISESTDIITFKKGKLKGFYHLPTGKKTEALYKYISATALRAFEGNDPFFEFDISGTLGNDKWDHYLLKGKKLYEPQDINIGIEGYIPKYRVERENGKSRLFYKITSRLALPKTYNSIKTFLYEDESLKYVQVESKKDGVQFFNDKLKLVSPVDDHWAKARFLNNQENILTIKKKKGKYGHGLFDLQKQEYIIEPEYCDIKLFRNQLISLRTDEGLAIADLDGNILSGFIYTKIQESYSNPYLIALRIGDRKQLAINQKGQQVFSDGFASISTVTMYPDSTGVAFCVKDNLEENAQAHLIDSAGKKLLDLPKGYEYKSLDGPLDMIFKQGNSGFYQFLVKDLTTQAISEDGDIYSRIIVLEKRDEHFFYQLPTKEKNYLYDGKGSLLFTFDKNYELVIRSNRNEAEHNHYFSIKKKGYRKDQTFDAYDLSGNVLVKGYTRILNNTFNQLVFMKGENKFFLDKP